MGGSEMSDWHWSAWVLLFVWQMGYILAWSIVKMAVLQSPEQYPRVIRWPVSSACMVFLSWPLLSIMILYRRAARRI
jgi:hypothetical protein